MPFVTIRAAARFFLTSLTDAFGASLVVVLWMASAQAQESVITMTPPYGDAERALGAGDSAAISRLLESAETDAQREMLSAYQKRVEFDLEASDLHAERCSTLARQHVEKYYEYESKCRALMAGNRLIDGDMPGWINLTRSALVAIESYARAEAHRIYPQKFSQNAPVLLPGAAWLPSAAPMRPKFLQGNEVSVLQRVPYGDEGHSPSGVPNGPYSIVAALNGQQAQFVFDTGAQTLIGGDLARRLGLAPIAGWTGGMQAKMYLQGRQVPAFPALIESLEVGPFEARNVVVLVSEDVSMPNVFGLNLMGKMPPFRLSARQLVIGGAPPPCNQGFSIASDLSGTQVFLVSDIEIDGQDVASDIDTGNPHLLAEFSGRAPAPWESEGRPVVVDGVRGVARWMAKDTAYGTARNAGAGVLVERDMFIDFARRKLCFLPVSSHN